MSEWLFRLSELLNDSYRTLTVWQWIILGALPPLVVLLYFLKLRRQPLEVPSTYLWHRTLEDLHVNSLWQRLRQNLLLFLQLLLLLLAILTCLRPSWRGDAVCTRLRFAGLLDLVRAAGFRVQEAGQYSVFFWIWELLPERFPVLDGLTPLFLALEVPLSHIARRWSAHGYCVAVPETGTRSPVENG